MASQILDLTDEDDINFFADDLPASDNSVCCPTIASENSTCCPTVSGNAVATTSSPVTTTTAASCESESLCCFVGDDASFDFDPATISSLLDCDLCPDYDPPGVTPAATAATYQLPATSVNMGAQSQDELSQLLLSETINGGNWPQDSPDSVIPSDMDRDARPGWMPWSCYTPDSGAQLPDAQPIQMMPPLMGYIGMDTLPTCAFLDSSIISRYQSMSSGDGHMGFFHGRTMMGSDTGMGGMGAEGGGLGGIYGMDSTQRVYNSINMQVTNGN